MVKPYQLLADAIIIRAALDYQDVLCGNYSCRETRQEITEFFESDFYDVLTDMDSGKLLRKLNTYCEDIDYNYKTLLKLRNETRYLLGEQ